MSPSHKGEQTHMRITMKTNEFITSIGKVPSWMTRPKKRGPYVKKVYCNDCLTTHEEGKHREEAK